MRLFAYPAFCLVATAALGVDHPPSPIAIYAQFENAPAQVALDEMKAELAGIMGPVGLDFEWRSLSGARNGEVSSELVVVTFNGKCSAEQPLWPPTGGGALGSTHVSDGNVLPFSDVECDRIRSFIQPALGGNDATERQRLFGRAVARVLAHELYHVLAKTARHAPCGAAKAFYSAVDLVRKDFRFDRKESQDLRRNRKYASRPLPEREAAGR